MSVRSINYLERGSVRPRRQSAEALADALAALRFGAGRVPGPVARARLAFPAI